MNVPLMLSGSPMCMYSRKKAPVKSKIINMGLHCEITGEIGPTSYMNAGMLVARLVSKLDLEERRRREAQEKGLVSPPRSCAFPQTAGPGLGQQRPGIPRKATENRRTGPGRAWRLPPTEPLNSQVGPGVPA